MKKETRRKAQKAYEKRVKRVTFVCSYNFYDELQSAALANNMTVSAYIKQTLFNAVQASATQVY